MDYLEKIIGDIETHAVEGIEECFENGVSPNELFRGKPLIYELTSEYGRTSRFKDCVKVFVDYGLIFDDKILLSVLLNDAISLEVQLNNHPEAVYQKYSL